jgi:putative intracellular protease/amidase
MAIDPAELQAFRRQRLADALVVFGGDKAALGRALGYRSGAFVRQMIEGERPIAHICTNTVAKAIDRAGSKSYRTAHPNRRAACPTPRRQAWYRHG